MLRGTTSRGLYFDRRKPPPVGGFPAINFRVWPPHTSEPNFIVQGISRKVLSLVQKENDVCRYKVDGPFRWFAQGPHTRRVCDDRAVADRLCGAHRAHAAAAPTRRSRAHARENTDGNSWQSRPRRACASHEAVLLPRGCRASAARCSARSRRPAAIVSAANVRAIVPVARE